MHPKYVASHGQVLRRARHSAHTADGKSQLRLLPAPRASLGSQAPSRRSADVVTHVPPVLGAPDVPHPPSQELTPLVSAQPPVSTTASIPSNSSTTQKAAVPSPFRPLAAQPSRPQPSRSQRAAQALLAGLASAAITLAPLAQLLPPPPRAHAEGEPMQIRFPASKDPEIRGAQEILVQAWGEAVGSGGSGGRRRADVTRVDGQSRRQGDRGTGR